MIYIALPLLFSVASGVSMHLSGVPDRLRMNLAAAFLACSVLAVAIAVWLDRESPREPPSSNA